MKSACLWNSGVDTSFSLIRKKIIPNMTETFQTSGERRFFIHEASHLQFSDSMAIYCVNVLLIR